MKQFLRFGFAPLTYFAPALALAQFSGGDGSLTNFLLGFTTFIQNSLIPLILAIAFVVFVYGAISYFLVADSDEGGGNREKGRKLMFWGIIAFVVIVSVWGIVALISGGLGLEDQELDVVPDVPAFR